MPRQQRQATKYPGVFFIEGTAKDGRIERIYYIRYRQGVKMVEEKAGRQFEHDMTPARAARIRTERIEGKALSNEGRREAARAAKKPRPTAGPSPASGRPTRPKRPSISPCAKTNTDSRNILLRTSATRSRPKSRPWTWIVCASP